MQTSSVSSAKLKALTALTMSLSNVWLLFSVVVGVVLCQYQSRDYRNNGRQMYFQQTEFQPQQYNQAPQSFQQTYGYQQPNGFQEYEALKTFQQPQQFYAQYQQPKAQYQTKFTRAYTAPQRLFTPAAKPYPAATEGQLKSYMDDMEEQRKEMNNGNQLQQEQPNNDSGLPARTHVNVLRDEQGYSYEIKLN